MAKLTGSLRVLTTALLCFSGSVEATVQAVVVYARTGERTPIKESNIRLTSTGAQQIYSLGEFFRSRFIPNAENHTDSYAPINSISITDPVATESVVLVRDQAHLQQAAQAFMQGFYPREYGSDPSSQLSNGNVRFNPLDGYQYSVVHTASFMDPNSIFLRGTDYCPNWDAAYSDYTATDHFTMYENETSNLYDMFGWDFLPQDLFPQEIWGYESAYSIYDYVRYQYVHNADVYNNMTDAGSKEFMHQLRVLADLHEWQLYGNMTATGMDDDGIQVIGGKTLAGKTMSLFDANIQSNGSYSKFNLIVGDYGPMLSLFSLLGLPNLNSDFMGLPDYASALVFELFSMDGNADGGEDNPTPAYPADEYPTLDNLYVRFFFRNGSDMGPGLPDDPPNASAKYQSYPIFGNGQMERTMSWSSFQNQMNAIMISDPGEWCTKCKAGSVFCPAYTGDLSFWGGGSGADGTGNGGLRRWRHGMTPEVAGVVGAMVTVAVLLLVLLGLLACGMRFGSTRTEEKPHGSSAAAAAGGGSAGLPRFWFFGRGRRHELGGFKGSAKLASDQDLTLARNGAPMGVGKGGARASDATIVVPQSAGDYKGHERVGSWELRSPSSPVSPMGKSFEAGLSFGAVEELEERRSLEAADQIVVRPVRPRESF